MVLVLYFCWDTANIELQVNYGGFKWVQKKGDGGKSHKP